MVLNPSTDQPINPSTHQPINPSLSISICFQFVLCDLIRRFHLPVSDPVRVLTV